MYERATGFTVLSSGGFSAVSTSLSSVVASATTFETVAANGLTVPTGTYRVRAEWLAGGTATGLVVRLATTGGTVTAPTTVACFGNALTETNVVEGLFRVTTGPATIIVEADPTGGGGAGSATVRVRLTVEKVA